MAKRFDCYIPGFWKCLWLKMRHPGEWQHRARAVVTDTKGGHCFQFTEEEEAIFDIAMDTTTEAPLSECLSSGRQFKRARFIRMSRDDWRLWWAGVEAQTLVERRR